MLKKKERLNREQFSRSFSLGRRIHSPLFTLVYEPTKKLGVAVVVSKKVARKAVLRNKIKRRVYNSIRVQLQHASRTGTFIFLVKPSVLKHSYQEITAEIQVLFKKTEKIIKK